MNQRPPACMKSRHDPRNQEVGLEYLYRYDLKRNTYVGRSPGTEAGSVVNENRPFLIILQSENDNSGDRLKAHRVRPAGLPAKRPEGEGCR